MKMVRTLLGLTLVALFLTLAGAASAQLSQKDRDYYQSWLSDAARAERVIDVSRASNAALEKLRAEIVNYREDFAKARDQNTDRIATLRSQIAALGAKPESGEEPEDIANLRLNLDQQLNALRVPRVVSEEAHSRANGLISEIDQIMRARQTKRLLSRGPSPLNPAHWPTAWHDVKRALTALINETRQNWQSEATRAKVQQELPVLLVLTALGMLLLLFGRRLSERLGDYLRGFGGRGTGVWSFVVSLARIFLPLVGTIFLVQAVTMTGVLGLRGALIIEAVPSWALILLVFNWLSDQLYGRHRETVLLPAPKNRHVEMMTYVKLLAVTLVLNDAVQLYEQIENVSAASRAVVAFPVIVSAALLLLRLHHVGLSERETADADDQPQSRAPGAARILARIRQGAVFLALISPVLAGLGYGAAAEAIVYPVILSLVVLSVTLILHRFFGDLYVWLWRGGDIAARDSLFSVLIGFALTLGAIPVMALVWGVRPANITELWSKFLDGFQIGDAHISPTGFLTFALIFVAGYSVTRLLQSGLRTSLLPKTEIDPGGQNAIVAFTGYLGIFLAALVAVSSAGLDLSSVAIVAGALSVGIGFGLQTIVSNFVSGIILLIERPIAKGDWIEVGGFAGYVRDISVRSTRIETFDRADVIVPNSDLIAGTVTNFTKGKTVGRVIVPVGVGYGTDTRMVEKILLEIANDHPMVLVNPPASVVFQGFGADALDFEIRAILRDVNWVLSVKSDMNHEIAKRFGEAGIEIPFAQRDIWLRNPEALMPQPPKTPPSEDQGQS
jgi:small-conductance mechanosensitive channel